MINSHRRGDSHTPIALRPHTLNCPYTLTHHITILLRFNLTTNYLVGQECYYMYTNK